MQQVEALAPRCEAVSEKMESQTSGAEQIMQALAELSEARSRPSNRSVSRVWPLTARTAEPPLPAAANPSRCFRRSGGMA